MRPRPTDPIDRRHQDRIESLLIDCNLFDFSPRHSYLSRLLGRDAKFLDELTRAEAQLVLGDLRKCKRAPNKPGRVIRRRRVERRGAIKLRSEQGTLQAQLDREYPADPQRSRVGPRQIFSLAAGEAWLGHERVWVDVLRELRLHPSTLPVIQKVLEETNWRDPNIKNVTGWVRAVVEREAKKMDLPPAEDAKPGAQAEAAAQRIPEIERRYHAGEITFDSYARELRQCYQDIDEDCYAGTVSDLNRGYNDEGERLTNEEWVDLQFARHAQQSGESEEIDLESMVSPDLLATDNGLEAEESRIDRISNLLDQFDRREIDERKLGIELEACHRPEKPLLVNWAKTAEWAGLDKEQGEILFARARAQSRDDVLASRRTETQRRKAQAAWKRLWRNMDKVLRALRRDEGARSERRGVTGRRNEETAGAPLAAVIAGEIERRQQTREAILRLQRKPCDGPRQAPVHQRRARFMRGARESIAFVTTPWLVNAELLNQIISQDRIGTKRPIPIDGRMILQRVIDENDRTAWVWVHEADTPGQQGYVMSPNRLSGARK